MPNWLKDTVFYEIYPQSFYDTNADGIGDIQGIIKKLDYIKELGCNALWINPCFDSPFKDAGYDVRDYKKIAPRYGTNDDMKELFEEAHKKGIHVLLDLVPGHTSEEHEWFKASGKAEKNEYSGRYIWTDFWIKGIPGHPYIGGETERNGTYMLNFFKCQPALNYGWKEKKESWQTGMHEPDALATREAIKDIMRFWLDMGCDGFRVDMADSLVKDDDENKSGTCEVWRDIRDMMDKDYPDAALVSEWSNPKLAINSAGFHMDFYLDHWHNGYNTLFRDYESNEVDNSYFKSDADGDINRFLKDYLDKYNEIKDRGYISFITCNHDTIRPRYNLSADELKIAFSFVFTMPGVPFLYYGDEIGMNYIPDMPTKEGGYTRTGTRTPMQWNNGINDGFSMANKELLYLPVDESESAVSVERQKSDRNSLYNTVREILALRHREEELQADAPFEVISHDKDKAFVYKRGSITIILNPKNKSVLSDVDTSGLDVIYSIGGIDEDKVRPQSFVVLKQADK